MSNEYRLPDGHEAEELRAGIEALISKADGTVTVEDLQGLLDRVDARDSLAYLEQRPSRSRRKDKTEA